MSKTQKHVKTAKQATASAAAAKAFTTKAATVTAAAKPTAADEPTHYERAMSRKTGASVAQLRKETAAAVNPKVKREPKNLCLCGCGQKCWKNFKQGHDQRLRGMLQRKEAQPLPQTVKQAVKIGVLVGEYKHANQEVLA